MNPFSNLIYLPILFSLMMETISEDGRFGLEERPLILAAIIRSNFENVFRVIDFMQSNVNDIKDM